MQRTNLESRRRHVTAWSVSGLTQAEYCQQHSINPKNFSRWNTQFHQGRECHQKRSKRSTTQESLQTAFIPVPLEESAISNETLETTGIKLLIGQWKIELSTGFDTACLRRLIQFLDAEL